MLRTVLITLVGAVPATLLSVFAVLLVGVGSRLVADGDMAGGFFFIAYGLIAILALVRCVPPNNTSNKTRARRRRSRCTALAVRNCF